MPTSARRQPSVYGGRAGVGTRPYGQKDITSLRGCGPTDQVSNYHADIRRWNF